ncbi:hypothetical protein CTRI78_v000227 [Colletotrichum trifolii]|uniref:Uncharacterized protein n=1 Tax=Colletotrichum trifolii TaxID=5466 RepID=A0A4V3HXM1_COLTR|nr:hypothetical protein CTRI78_v000227 [Colletotrichum trifolii]
MPSSTLSQLQFHNAGPLTTTWTAPTSCATMTSPVGLGWYPYRDTGVLYLSENCDVNQTNYNDCAPSAAAIEEDWRGKFGDPARRKMVYYHSPGLACPASWTTVGVAARDDVSSYSLSGIFASPTVTEKDWRTDLAPTFEPINNQFVSALEPRETLVVCCPDGYKPISAGGGCFSEVPRELYTATTGCQFIDREDAPYTVVTVTYTYYGKPVTGLFQSLTGTADHWDSRVETIEPSQSSEYFGLIQTPAVSLVRKAEDFENTSTAQSASATPSVSPTSSVTTGGSRRLTPRHLAEAVFAAWVIGLALTLY